MNIFNRRELAHHLSFLAAAPAFFQKSKAATTGLHIGPDIYQSIGVRPIINCRGTLTVVGGSLELPEVKAAKEAAANHFVLLRQYETQLLRRGCERRRATG